jgi:hypothetical protein
MGKRSDYERRELDFYATPKAAVLPILPHLQPRTSFSEPCAGAGDLIGHLEGFGHRCVSAFDVAPRSPDIRCADASFMQLCDLGGADCIITNPPWDRHALHQIIERSLFCMPAWLLFDADWMHTRQAIPYLRQCSMVVSVGRVKWIEGSSGAGKDNCCWYKFDPDHLGRTVFVGRQ